MARPPVAGLTSASSSPSAGAGDVLASIDPRLCVACKGARGLCGIDPCPLLARVRSHLPRTAPMGRDFMGSSPPSLFVGRHGYPKVTVGPMLPPDRRDEAGARRLDDPDRKSTRLNSSHSDRSRMPSSA